MSLTDGDKAECKEIARVIVSEVLIQHIGSCPHGRKLLNTTFLLIGVCIGSGIASGTLVFGIAKLIGI